MDPAQVAARLIESEPAEREQLIRTCHASDAPRLARALHDVYQVSNAGDPRRAAAAAATLQFLADRVDQPEVSALAAWTCGMAAVHLDGRMERGVALLGDAAERFSRLRLPLDAAAIQVSRLQGLAMLGRYDEAVACGLQARDVFRRTDDALATGKIEQNLGNVAYRRGRFQEAEMWYRSARTHYVRVDSLTHLAQIDNNLGTVLCEEHRFAEAESAFEQSLERAERADLAVTRTEVHYNLGCLAMFRGQYDRALGRLETARRAYAELHMPHRAARAELDLMDAYLELNLAPEAATIATRLAGTFAELGMRAELARAIGGHGRAAAQLGQLDQARRLLVSASQLYTDEGNVVDAAFLRLVEAQLLYAEVEFAAAAEAAARAEPAFVAARMWGRLLLARWLRGEAWRRAGHVEARPLLESVLQTARERQLPQIAYRCLTSLGLLADSAGDAAGAEQAFSDSVELIETLRAPLPAEEFRVAFLSDKLTPFGELVRLSLDARIDDRATRAFAYVERARSRALVDMLAGVVTVRAKPRDAYEKALIADHDRVREELQWFYSQINRREASVARDPEAIDALYSAVRERETALLQIRRRIEQQRGAVPDRGAAVNVSDVQRHVGRDAALVEYFSLDGQLMAFVITDQHVEVVENLATESDLERGIGQLRSQIDTIRLGGHAMDRHMPRLVERVRQHSQRLYQSLLGPLERFIDQRRLVIVPHRALHYVPFHALHDGEGYVIERRAVSYAPSAVVLSQLLDRPRRPMRRPVLIGVTDERAPWVRDEVVNLARELPSAIVRLDGSATIAEVRQLAGQADLLHLACHGQFRPDNPLFSALHLSDDWLTVRDAYDLDLQCGLVVLSACETGVNDISPGEELVGLARGFFSAGTPSLMVSLWTVDDSSTAELMLRVYQGLIAGLGPADALAAAQRQLMQRYPHPYYWSAFFVLGRW